MYDSLEFPFFLYDSLEFPFFYIMFLFHISSLRLKGLKFNSLQVIKLSIYNYDSDSFMFAF